MKSILLLLLSIPAMAQTPSSTEQMVDVKDIQQCGLITRFPGDIINPNCFQQSTNILTDRTGILTRRQGYSQYNTTPCEGSAPIRGMWPFFAQNGTQYLILFSSTSMFSSPADGSCNPITGLHSNLSPTATMECTQALGQLWCTDGVDQPFSTNATTATFVTQAPIGKHIGTFRNRVLISGVVGTGANGSGSQVYLSGELNGYDYTIPAIQLTTSPAIISVNGINDGLIVNCLMGEFQNQFLIGRDYDLWGLSGYDLSDFALRKISSQVGCLEPRSVQEVTNVLYWLSFRGIEGYSGTQINRVSYPIDPLIATIITSAGNTRTQTFTSQSDWQSGNLTASGPGAPMSATISPGDVVISSNVLTQNTSTQFSLWSVQSSTAATFSIGSAVPDKFSISPNFANTPASLTVDSPGFDNVFSTPTFNCGYSITATETGGFSNFTSSMSMLFSATGVNGPWGSPIQCISTSAVSLNSFPNNTAVPLTGGSSSPGNSRYAKFRLFASFVSPTGQASIALSSFSILSETTGYYITPCVLVSSPTSYGNFLVDAVNNGGSFSFWISTGSTCGVATATNANWSSQIPNSVITATTSTQYLAARVLFSIDSATETPTLNDVTFTWNNGSSRPPTTSARWDDRYLLFFTSGTLSSSVNDHVIIYDQNQKWQLWDDEYAASSTLYQNTLYTGDSKASGLIYQQDVGQSDNGNPYTMTFQTADFDGGDPNMNKEFSRAYIMLSAPNNSNSSASLSCNYAIDGSSTTYSLGSVALSESPESSGYFVAKIPFPVSNPVTGHWIGMTCSASGTVGPIAVHRIRLVYSNLSWD